MNDAQRSDSAHVSAEKRADIQGLRGVAVLAVVLYHASHVLVPGGFAGVDVFFVLSGFLITRILLDGMEAEDFRPGKWLIEFYRRRVRRLFPALYVVLAATLIAGLLILPPKLLKELVYTQFFTSLFSSNLVLARLSDYFATESSLKPLRHTWSLAVEEQFYLAYPLVLLAVRRFAARFLWPILIALAVASLVWSQIALGLNAQAAFYLPASRAFELLLGALCVAAERHLTLTPGQRRLLSLSGLAVLVLSLGLLRDGLPFPGVLALPPCLATACLLIARGGWGGRLLSAPPLTMVGDMSYSLYLWHWPVLVFGRMVLGEAVWVTVVCVVGAFGLASLSRHFIEQPFLDGRVRRVWLWGGLAMAASIVTALLVYGANGLPGRFDARQQAAFSASDDVNHDRRRCHAGKDQRIAYAETCTWGDAKARPSVAVWGDSYGAELAVALGERLAPAKIGVRQISASACPPSVGFQIAFNPGCRPHNADMLLHLKSDPQITTVVLTTDYQRYEGADQAAMLGGLELSALDLRTAGKRVVIVYPVPVYDFDPPSQTGLAMRLGRDPGGVGMSLARFGHDNAAILAELDAFTRDHDIAVVHPSDVLCDVTACHVWSEEAGVLYFNSRHLSLAGARVVASLVTIPAPPRRAE